MDTDSLRRLDTFPYRHRVAELMASPIVSLAAGETIAAAARLMAGHRVSSVLILDRDGRAAGILTERDVLRVLARRGGQALAARAATAMSAPVHAIEADSLVYRAMARMARLGLRHLPVVDAERRPLGMLTAGALLRQRATLALTLGDEIAAADGADALRAAHDKLPPLAQALRREKASATEVSAVISGVIRDLTARAAELAMAEAGGPQGRWCLLALGSAGRGEALLAPDQDNALVLDKGADETWFAAFARRFNALLGQAGVPLCKGGVMARNRPWRRSLAEWRDQIDDWVSRPQPEALLNVDIFYDFAPVLGDSSLAAELRRHATEAAAASPVFLRLLAAGGDRAGSAFDLIGRWRLAQGRLDLKRHGLLPIVAGARAIGLAWQSRAAGTDGRLDDAVAAGGLAADSAQAIAHARAVVVQAILDQQLADIAAGRTPGNQVDPSRLKRRDQGALREALHTADGMPGLVRDALSRRKLAA
jgi:signal-transduction protein with cAMP-binding, CBS, and nucleotidyltransferase domain